MATRISVTVKGPMGLDDPDRMLDDLARATSVPWQAHEVDKGPVLTGGIVEIVLTAVIGKGVEMSVAAGGHGSRAGRRTGRRAVGRRCGRLRWRRGPW